MFLASTTSFAGKIGIVLGIIIVVVLLYLLYKIVKNYKIVLLVCVALITVGAIVSFMVETTQPNNPRVAYIHQTTEETLDFHIVYGEEFNYLAYTNGQQVELLDASKKVIDDYALSPIYLRDLGDLYVVVFSLDAAKEIQYNRLILHDKYGFNNLEDQIYVISKASGNIGTLQDYDLTGKAIKLDSITYHEDQTLIYEVCWPYENKTAYVFSCLLTDDFLNGEDSYDSYYFGLHPIVIAYSTYDSDTKTTNDIIKVAYTNKLCLFQISDGSVDGNYIKRAEITVTSNTSEFSTEIRPVSEDLINNSLIKDGYFVAKNNMIYYIGYETSNPNITYSIYVLLTNTMKEEFMKLDGIDDLDGLEHWEDLIS